MKRRKTVLLFHGFPDKIVPQESALYQYFFDRKYRIIMPDLFGSTDFLHIPALCDSVEEMLNGVRPDVIVGVSTGGLIAPLVPKGLYRWVYIMVHRHDTSIPGIEMKRRADRNLDGFRTIPTKKVQEILHFVVFVDNTEVLQYLLNETLIIAGSLDRMMPLGLSREMNALLKKSRLVYADRTHYDVFTKKEYHHLDIFLT